MQAGSYSSFQGSNALVGWHERYMNLVAEVKSLISQHLQ